MKVTAPTSFRVVIDLDFLEALALYKIILTADHRALNLEWPDDIDELDTVVAALQVQLCGIVE